MRDHTKLRAFELADELAVLIYRIAFSSLRELHYQFGLAVRLGYISDINARECDLKFNETEKVIAALIRAIRGS